MPLNNIIASETQTKKLTDKISTSLNGIDLNYKGYDRTDSKSEIELSKTKAHVNRVLLWLSSKRDDYVRESFKGGILYDMLGKLNNTTNIEEWETSIKTKFNNEFSGDLDLILLRLTTDKTYRKLIVNMIVRDKIENITFPVSTEATL